MRAIRLRSSRGAVDRGAVVRMQAAQPPGAQQQRLGQAGETRPLRTDVVAPALGIAGPDEQRQAFDQGPELAFAVACAPFRDLAQDDVLGHPGDTDHAAASFAHHAPAVVDPAGVTVGATDAVFDFEREPIRLGQPGAEGGFDARAVLCLDGLHPQVRVGIEILRRATPDALDGRADKGDTLLRRQLEQPEDGFDGVGELLKRCSRTRKASAVAPGAARGSAGAVPGSICSGLRFGTPGHIRQSSA